MTLVESWTHCFERDALFPKRSTHIDLENSTESAHVIGITLGVMFYQCGLLDAETLPMGRHVVFYPVPPLTLGYLILIHIRLIFFL